MNFLEEPKRQTPIFKEADVLVLGAGPAGFSAAVCAAREGAATVLIEQNGDVGGMATSGLMSHWTGDTSGGFYEEILERAAETADTRTRKRINPERLKTVMLQMLREAGADVCLYTSACDAVTDGKVLKGVVTESKSGRRAILSKVTIDATGDGDIAAKAGAPFFTGRETDGKMQPVTLMFKVAGVDTERAVFPGSFEDRIQIPAGEIQQLARENITAPAGHVLLYRTGLPGVVTCNMTNFIGADGTKAEDLTEATMVCRNQIDEIVSFLRKFVPGYENCFLISSASMIGVRETRHFKGEAVITERDILEARIFEDWAVTKANFNFDVHNLTGSGLDATGSQKTFKQKKGYTIPYGCFVPLEVENLLLAGRNISGTHMAHSNYRVMPICANMGQSVGIASAICAKTGVTPRNLDIEILQGRLRELGVTP